MNELQGDSEVMCGKETAGELRDGQTGRERAAGIAKGRENGIHRSQVLLVVTVFQQ